MDYIHASVPKNMLADLKDSVRNNRSLNIQDKYGATAVSAESAPDHQAVANSVVCARGIE